MTGASSRVQNVPYALAENPLRFNGNPSITTARARGTRQDGGRITFARTRAEGTRATYRSRVGTGGRIASAAMPILAARPSEKYLDDLRGRLPDLRLTYEEVGATTGPVLPKGYHHDRVLTDSARVRRSGPGPRSCADLASSPSAGATISPAEALIAVGSEVVATVRLGLLFIVAPSRVVYVTAEPDRFGFAYGTLPGHPERGEEAFHVTRHGDGTVRLEIVAFSRPATVIARLGRPLSRLAQARTTRLYLDGSAGTPRAIAEAELARRPPSSAPLHRLVRGGAGAVRRRRDHRRSSSRKGPGF